mgnify:FL=1
MIAPQPTAPVRPATEPAPAPAPNRDPVPPSLVACPDCDLLNRLDGPAAATLLCARCGAVLRRHRPDSIDRTLALVVAALLLFALANSFPFLAMQTGGLVQETTLLSGVHELWRQDLRLLAALVFCTCVLVPAAQLIGLGTILLPLRLGRRPPPGATRILRLVQAAAPWGMMEVFMLGILVALVKLGHMATIVPGVSVFSFAALIVVMAAALSTLDPALVWARLDPRP